MQIKNKMKMSRRKKFLTGGVVAAAFAVLGVGAYLWLSSADQQSSNQDSIDYNPPTQEQKDAGEQTKNDVISSKNNEQTDSTPTPGEKKSITVTIVDAGQYERSVEVRAFAGNIVEDGGVCTIEFTKGSSRLVKTASTVISANTTQCSPLKVATAEFPSLGAWSVIVKYESSTSSGTSSAQTIELK